jgi:S-formylglutathione hydrolase FrmB
VLPRRGIGGVSLGGNEAIVLALKNPGTFASVSSMSGTLDLVEPATRTPPGDDSRQRHLDVSAVELAKAKPEQTRALNVLLTVGVSDPWAKSSRNLDEVLTRNKAPHDLREGPGDHSWSYWLEVLPAHVEWHASLLHEARDVALPTPANQKRTGNPLR